MSYKFDIGEFPYFCGKFPIPKGTILCLGLDQSRVKLQLARISYSLSNY